MQERITAINMPDIAEVVRLEGEKLVHVVRQQSRPRRWPWQAKTLYDLAHERSAEAVELAAERSAALAAAVAQERDALLAQVRQQSQPRRWFWQAKTARDHVDEQSARLAARAATISAQLAEQAAQRRDALLAQVRQQSQPRRLFWQAKTARDHVDERGAALHSASDDATSKVRVSLSAAREALRHTVAEAPQAFGATAGAAVDTLKGAADTARQRVSDTAATAVDTLQGAADTARQRVSDTAATAVDTLQGAADTARQRVSDTTGAAADTLQGAADAARQRVSDTTGAVSGAINNRVEATTGAIGETIAAGQRGVRRGARLVRWSFWSFVGGVVAGVLVAPRSGEETRRELGAAAQHLSDTLFPPDRA